MRIGKSGHLSTSNILGVPCAVCYIYLHGDVPIKPGQYQCPYPITGQ